MPILARKPQNDIAMIPEGTFQAVCYAVWDLGKQETTWNGNKKISHKVLIAWEINQTINAPNSNYHGKRYVITNRYTLSLGSKANLRHHLEAWRGKAFSEDELAGFDLEKLIGANCLINITHNKGNERTFANITAIMKTTPGTNPMIPENDQTPPEWVRDVQSEAVSDDFPQTGNNPFGEEQPPDQAGLPPVTDDDLPF